MTARRIVLPSPLPHQLDILASPARHKVCVCGRRFGKTTLCLVCVLDGHGPGGKFRGAARGAQGMWVAPTFGVAEDIWRSLKSASHGAWLDKSEQARRISFPGGGSVMVRSADNPDNLRGVGLDFLVIDEVAYVVEEAWTEVLRPTLADRQGWTIFISTPRGDGWFRDLFDRCERQDGWARWQRPTADNPRIPPAEIEASRRELGSYVFAQEFLAEFVTPGGGLFKREHTARYELEPGGVYRFDDGTYSTLEVMRRDGGIFATVDTATSEKTSADYTAIAVWGVTTRGKLVLLDLDMRRIEAPAIVEAIRGACDRWDCVPWIEETSQSKHLLSFLQAQGVAFRTVTPGSQDKIMRAAEASALHEQRRLVLPREAHWLVDFERQLYSFPPQKGSKGHDDAVDVSAYAARIFLHELGGDVPDPGPVPIVDRLPPGIALRDPRR